MLGLHFRQVEDGYTLPQKLAFDADFYEADIRIDAILSYPWMVQAKVGVFPHYNALAIDKPRLILLYGLVRKGGGKEKPWHRDAANVVEENGEPLPAGQGGKGERKSGGMCMKSRPLQQKRPKILM